MLVSMSTDHNRKNGFLTDLQCSLRRLSLIRAQRRIGTPALLKLLKNPNESNRRR
jgi:hypothetical protein